MKPTVLIILVSLLVAACGSSVSPGAGESAAIDTAVFEGPVPRAQCGPGSQPETDIQGRVPIDDRQSGRAGLGYACNLELIGAAGDGASWQHVWYDDCSYYGTKFTSQAGVQVVDARDSSNPKLAAPLISPAMLDPWESLKVNEKRGLLGAVAAYNGGGPVFFDVYDVKEDCTQPVMKASVPAQLPAGHEGAWAPDGKTYYGTMVTTSAIDVSDPTLPKALGLLVDPAYSMPNIMSHGLSISEDGNRAYMTIGVVKCADGNGVGMKIVDVSAIQSRAPEPLVKVISEVCWPDGASAQHSIPVTIKGRKYVIFVDEGGMGMARIIDINDEAHPFVIAKLKNEINMPDAEGQRTADGGASGFTYQGHYCAVDQLIEPTVAACSYFWQGIRIFDIRDPYHPAEIAYFIPAANATPGPTSQSGPTPAGYASAQVRFVKERGEIWFTDQGHGFMIARFTNGVWPFKD